MAEMRVRKVAAVGGEYPTELKRDWRARESRQYAPPRPREA
jgi:hypothetical protein